MAQFSEAKSVEILQELNIVCKWCPVEVTLEPFAPHVTQKTHHRNISSKIAPCGAQWTLGGARQSNLRPQSVK